MSEAFLFKRWYCTTFSAVIDNADWISAAVQSGWIWRNNAIEPATCGDAIDVPLIAASTLTAMALTPQKNGYVGIMAPAIHAARGAQLAALATSDPAKAAPFQALKLAFLDIRTPETCTPQTMIANSGLRWGVIVAGLWYFWYGFAIETAQFN